MDLLVFYVQLDVYHAQLETNVQLAKQELLGMDQMLVLIQLVQMDNTITEANVCHVLLTVYHAQVLINVQPAQQVLHGMDQILVLVLLAQLINI